MFIFIFLSNGVFVYYINKIDWFLLVWLLFKGLFMINYDERESCVDGLKGLIKMISGYELLNNFFLNWGIVFIIEECK